MKKISVIISLMALSVLVQLGICQESNPSQQAKSSSHVAPAVRDTIWIDVRTPNEFVAGHLVEATNIPLQVFEQEFSQMVPNKKSVVALYCRSGNRSGQALKIAQSQGYSRAFNAGGFADLSSKRMPK